MALASVGPTKWTALVEALPASCGLDRLTATGQRQEVFKLVPFLSTRTTTFSITRSWIRPTRSHRFESTSETRSFLWWVACSLSLRRILLRRCGTVPMSSTPSSKWTRTLIPVSIWLPTPTSAPLQQSSHRLLLRLAWRRPAWQFLPAQFRPPTAHSTHSPLPCRHPVRSLRPVLAPRSSLPRHPRQLPPTEEVVPCRPPPIAPSGATIPFRAMPVAIAPLPTAPTRHPFVSAMPLKHSKTIRYRWGGPTLCLAMVAVSCAIFGWHPRRVIPQWPS